MAMPFPPDYVCDAHCAIEILEKDRWVDASTRMLIAVFNLYNPSTNINLVGGELP